MSSKKTLSLVQHLKNYEALFKKAKAAPQMDIKKVNRLRKAIKEGKYQVDFEKLADKILEDF